MTTQTPETVTATVYGTVYGAATTNREPTTTLSFEVSTMPSVSTTTLVDATAGTAYSQGLHATGGFAPYTWSVTQGTLPSGLTLDASTGVISGTPTGTATSHFTVQVTDAAGNTASQVLTLTVNAESHIGSSTPAPAENYFGTVVQTVNMTTGTPETINVQGSEVTLRTEHAAASGNTVTITTQSLDTLPQITKNLPSTANVTAAVGIQYQGSGFPLTVTIANPSIQIGSAVDEWVNGTLEQVPATVVNGQVTLQISSNTDLVVVSPKPMVLYPNVREMVWDGQTYGYQAMVKKDPNTGGNTTYMPIWYVMQALEQVGIQSTWNGHTWSMTTSNSSAVTTTSGNTLSQQGDMTITLNGHVIEVPGIVGEDMIHGNKTTFMPIWYVMQILKQAGIHSDWTGSMWALYPTDSSTTQQ